jgi:hypothetical protein
LPGSFCREASRRNCQGRVASATTLSHCQPASPGRRGRQSAVRRDLITPTATPPLAGRGSSPSTLPSNAQQAVASGSWANQRDLVPLATATAVATAPRPAATTRDRGWSRPLAKPQNHQCKNGIMRLSTEQVSLAGPFVLEAVMVATGGAHCRLGGPRHGGGTDGAPSDYELDEPGVSLAQCRIMSSTYGYSVAQ